MKIDILTLFPQMFEIFDYSIIGRARENTILTINTINMRDYTTDKHRKVDDYPYGGGAGMVMSAQPIVDSIRKIKETNKLGIWLTGQKNIPKWNADKNTEHNYFELKSYVEGILRHSGTTFSYLPMTDNSLFEFSVITCEKI